MALPVLRPISKLDPRPTTRSLEVLGRAYETQEDDIRHWALNRGMAMDPADLKACVMAGVQAGNDDAYRAARCLEEAFGFHADFTFVILLNEVLDRAPLILPSVIREWVLRTQHRFPGRPGDLVVFRDKWRHHRSGRVVYVRNSEAAAMVAFENTDREEMIWAENVIENRTTGETPGARRPVTLMSKVTPIR